MREPTIETQQTYDVIAAEYARWNSTVHPRLLEDVGSMTASLLPGSLVADVGCGPGREIALLREQGRYPGFSASSPGPSAWAASSF